MRWGTVKRAVASANRNFQLSEVESLSRQEVLKYTPEVFTKFIDHVEEVENKFRKIGTILDELSDGSDDESSYEPSDEDSGVEASEKKFNKRYILLKKYINSAECAVYSAQQCEYMLQFGKGTVPGYWTKTI